MKPSERFKKKVMRKPPKAPAKGYKLPRKKGMGRCASCKKLITSSKSRLMRRSFSIPKNKQRTNRPYGGYLCNKCLKEEIIRETRKISAES